MVVRRYYGFEGDGCTYDELGRQMGISGGRVKQIIDKALRKLRHPSRCRILRPHVTIAADRKIEIAEREIEAAKRSEAAARIAEALRVAEARRISEDLRQRIGDEIGSSPSSSWWSDDRRRSIAGVLASVTNEVVTEVRETHEIYGYLREHLSYSWMIYAAWKRDVRRRLRNNNVSFTRGVMEDGSYLIYARQDRHTWYLFNVGYEQSCREVRWVGYVKPGEDSVRFGRLRALDQTMSLIIAS